MAAIALPISELEPIRTESRRAQAETECVVVCATQERAEKGAIWAIIWKTVVLRHRFQRLTARQQKFVSCLIHADFNRTPSHELVVLAQSLDDLVADERNILVQANSLGVEIRAWWEASLLILAEQAEYLDSIATSLRSAGDPEVSQLMGLAVQRMATSRELVEA